MGELMKAIVCEKAGPDGYATYRDFPVPSTPEPGEVIVDTRNMSINFPDGLQIKGLYQSSPSCPFVLGMEFSGIVRQVGEGVTRFKPGDRIVGLFQGAFAETIKLSELLCYPLPDSISFEHGCLLPLAGGTALYGLHYRGHLAKGETVAVLGAAGGTGLAAVQIAKAFGATVIGICSTNEKCQTAREYGADQVINYREEDLSASLKKITHGRGVDVIYDTVGGDLFNIASRRVAWKGRILTVGYASGTIPQLPINLALIKGYSLVGVHWAAALISEPKLCLSVISELMQMYIDGSYTPVIDSCTSLENGVAAIEKMQNRQVIGKILLSSSSTLST